MPAPSLEERWAGLRAPGIEVPAFDPATTHSLPDPARRFLRRAVTDGAPLAPAVELEMVGAIKLGPRWFPFTARQILRRNVGLIWQATVGGHILRFKGADTLGPDGARLDFKLHGLIPVARATGIDVLKSARGRLAAETVAWLPQALTPQLGTRWHPIDDHHARVAVPVGDEVVVYVEVAVDDNGVLNEIALQRWNDSAKPPRAVPFGASITMEHITRDGVRIAGGGSVAWEWGTPAESAGEFFRYTITSARFVGL